MASDVQEKFTDASRFLVGQERAAKLNLIRHPTPEHAEYQKKAREAMHDEIQRVRDCVYMFDGEDVFDSETIQMLYKLSYALHDVVDGNPVGTLERRSEEQSTPPLKPLTSLDDL
jgi:hypothetical protein